MNDPHHIARHDLQPLHELPKLAAAYIGTHGWVQGTDQASDGKVCLTGALRLCSPVPGDGYIAREVFRRRDRAETWNDKDGRSAEEVIDYLSADKSVITDEELEGTFGPQWRGIVEQVRTISGATVEQVNELAAARAAARDAARAAARDAAWAAAWDAAGDAAWDAAGDAAWDAAGAAARDAAWAAAWDAAWAAARDAAWDAARALVVRDLIGQNGYTQDHYDLLTRPWRKVFGPLHADDAEVD